jgi:RNA 3'-terminal phosphate cyclase (ATP)
MERAVAWRRPCAARDYLAHAAPVGPYLADQLLLPMAFGGVSTFATCEPTLHFTSNCDVIAAHRSDSLLFNVIRYTIWS